MRPSVPVCACVCSYIYSQRIFDLRGVLPKSDNVQAAFKSVCVYDVSKGGVCNKGLREM